MSAAIGTSQTTSTLGRDGYYYVIETRPTRAPDPEQPPINPEPRWKIEQRNAWKRRRK